MSDQPTAKALTALEALQLYIKVWSSPPKEKSIKDANA